MADNYNFNPYSGSNTRHIRKIDYAYQLIAQKRWAEADRILDQILEEYPNDANALAGKKLLSREVRLEAKAQKPPSKLAIRRAQRRAEKIVKRERYAERMRKISAEKELKQAEKEMKKAEEAMKKAEKAELDAARKGAEPMAEKPEKKRRGKRPVIVNVVLGLILLAGIVTATVCFKHYQDKLDAEDVPPQSSITATLPE